MKRMTGTRPSASRYKRPDPCASMALKLGPPFRPTNGRPSTHPAETWAVTETPVQRRDALGAAETGGFVGQTRLTAFRKS